MKAVGYKEPLPVDHPDALVDIELPEPSPSGRDILVEVRAISVNPVDTKIRRSAVAAPGEFKVLGWDAAGVVRAVGSEVTLFKAGDRVMYAVPCFAPVPTANSIWSTNGLSGACRTPSTSRKPQPCR
jgi:NADPH:quinone reductase-like Zn-dependent oxidoreductase